MGGQHRRTRYLLTGLLFSMVAALPPVSHAAELRSFSSSGELRNFLKDRVVRSFGGGMGGLEEVVVTARRVAETITNNQEEGVDEGDIVKARDANTLVILRRGRLITVSLVGGKMKVIDRIDAYPPKVDANDDWYDEMLVAGNTVVVIGYSYGRGGTEINRFRIDAAGRLTFQDSHHVRSNDYYSSRNYASRLIGNRLIFYVPLDLTRGGDPLDALPALRRWSGDPEQFFKRIASPQDIYVPSALWRSGSGEVDTLHTVVTCDLRRKDLRCSSTGVLGGASRTFYVSREAIYLWINDAVNREDAENNATAFLYRLPLDGEAPGAVMARGAPVDQFSFQEDDGRRVLDVLVRTEGYGDSMWKPSLSAGSAALLSLPLSSFESEEAEAPLRRYRQLPIPQAALDEDLHSRFVGDYLIYGFDLSAYPDGDALPAYSVPVRGGDAVALPLNHTVSRIEALGENALLVGSDKAWSLHFTALEISGQGAPTLGHSLVAPETVETEDRSHAFYFKPDAGPNPEGSGIVGLPIQRVGDDPHSHGIEAMSFMRRSQRRLISYGELAAVTGGVIDDRCEASCVDWYGNARPIFLGGRVFALLGNELVEGSAQGSKIRELSRINLIEPAGAE